MPTALMSSVFVCDGQSATAARQDTGESRENEISYTHRLYKQETWCTTQDHVRSTRFWSGSRKGLQGGNLDQSPCWGFLRKRKATQDQTGSDWLIWVIPVDLGCRDGRSLLVPGPGMVQPRNHAPWAARPDGECMALACSARLSKACCPWTSAGSKDWLVPGGAVSLPPGRLLRC